MFSRCFPWRVVVRVVPAVVFDRRELFVRRTLTNVREKELRRSARFFFFV